MLLPLGLFAAALAASVFGSMVGLGGGFILVPILRLAFGFAPAEAAGTALALVVANSGAGATTYLLQKRVHVTVGVMLALGGIPGSILGAMISHEISALTFDWLLATFLVVVASDMVLNRHKRAARDETRRITEMKGMSYRASVAVGFLVGIASSLFGIGGGVIVVPTLLYLSELPAHAISATSHFAIVLTSPVGLVTHAFQHDIRLADVLPLVAGGLLGGPIGARLSLRLKSPQLLLFVSAAMFIAAASLVLRHFVRS